ncbi:CHASE domain-containing protein [Hyphococcus sp.]|uniref:CHASE domain-containing protein n=1 Tax=Hyphococcus sp. TaxID=2038636 RepID=UPI0035C6ECCB
MKINAALLAMLLVTILSVIGAWAFSRNDYLAVESYLQQAALEIEQRIEEQISVLHAAKGLFLTVGDVDRNLFKDYLEASDVRRRVPGMQGVGYAKRLRPGEEADIEARLSRDYGLDRAVWPETDQNLRYPIVLLEPDDERNHAALGFDMFSEAVRREAMMAASQSGQATASRPVKLVQEIDEEVQAGFLIYLPLFVEENIGGAPDGYVYAPFRAHDLFRAVLSTLPDIDVTAAYSEGVNEDVVLYGGGDQARGAHDFVIKVGGRDWTIYLKPKQERFSAWRAASLLSIIAGIMATLFFWRLFRENEARIQALQALADERKARADMKDLYLKETNHRFKNLLARILSIARLSSRSASNLDDYLRDFSRRLEAMSRTQDLLAASARRKASLSDLLRDEIDLMCETSDKILSLSGPEVALTEMQVQSLGLVIHELATNSAKYGAFKKESRLDISWRCAKNPAGCDEVHIVWMEEGFDHEDPVLDREGFGSKLAKLMVEGQLEGVFNRKFEKPRLIIEISFPLA